MRFDLHAAHVGRLGADNKSACFSRTAVSWVGSVTDVSGKRMLPDTPKTNHDRRQNQAVILVVQGTSKAREHRGDGRERRPAPVSDTAHSGTLVLHAAATNYSSCVVQTTAAKACRSARPRRSAWPDSLERLASCHVRNGPDTRRLPRSRRRRSFQKISGRTLRVEG